MELFSLHKFKSLGDANFSISDYSKLKYGAGEVAKKFGYELADAIFEKYRATILTNSTGIIVFESAYSHVRNAASLITEFFIKRLNRLLIASNGEHIMHGKINRTIPYIADYGKLPMADRIRLLESDQFSIDKEFVNGKYLIFIDDVFITGTHHKKIESMLEFYRVPHHDPSKCLGVYYAELEETPDMDPAIESLLNSEFIKSPMDLIKLIAKDSDYRVIVRSLKMILAAEPDMLSSILEMIPSKCLDEMYDLCLGEGYYKNISYATNFSILQKAVLDESK